MPIVAAGIAGGASLLSGYMASKDEKEAQKKAQKYSDQERAAAFRYLTMGRQRDAFGSKLEHSALKAAHARELAGFEGGRKALNLGAIQARETAKAQGKMRAADVEQSAVTQGLLGTSTGAQAFTGITDSTTAQLQAVDAQLAQAFADLGLNEAQTRGRQGMEEATFQGRQRDIQREYDMMLAELAPRGYGQTYASQLSGWGKLLAKDPRSQQINWGI